MNNKLSNVSMNGRMAYIIMCVEAYLKAIYPQKDWLRCGGIIADRNEKCNHFLSRGKPGFDRIGILCNLKDTGRALLPVCLKKHVFSYGHFQNPSTSVPDASGF